MFKVGDYAVCPGDGVGQVCDIVEKKIGDQAKTFYLIKIISNGMTMLVPVEGMGPLKVRPLVDDLEITQVYGLLSDHDIKIDNSTWNRRNREYSNKIRTGSLIEIADVLRNLFLLKATKTLSFGEKKMLDRCKELLSQEIALSGGQRMDEVTQKIESCFDSKMA
jgi:CarD family transcriptional regulator